MTGAVISDCGSYRYRLDRTIDAGLLSHGQGNRIVWVMLNPSTADATTDDPTMRRVLGFSESFGFYSVTVVNLFALRSPKPSALVEASDPVGPECDRYITEAMNDASTVVCAWGAGVPTSYQWRAGVVLRMIGAAGHEPMVLGRTAGGEPRHPLYMPGDSALRSWGET